MIKVSNLSKFYGNNKVLDDISLEIPDGEIYGLIGRSGAGKSTLLRCINRLEDFQSGSLNINGIELQNLKGNELRSFRKNVGMIFQHFSLMQRITVYDNIALPLECWGYDREVINKKVKELADVVGISDKLNSKPKELSGGQQQRVAIARALALDSKILLSDESTSALDPKTTESILDLLIDINKKMGITIVVVAHQMEVIKKICDRVTVLDHGKLAISGKVEDIFLYEQEKLNEILGGGENIILPQEGINFKIIAAEKDRDKKIISSMARDLDILYSVPWSNIEKFKDSIYSVIYANVNIEDEEKVIKYLNDKEMNWRKIENEQ